MAAVGREAPPRVIALGGIAGILAAVRDAWRITWCSGRPMAVRARALALVLLAALAIGSVGTLGVVGAARLLATDATPSPARRHPESIADEHG